MKKKRLISLLLVFVLMLTTVSPVLAVGAEQARPLSVSADENTDSPFVAFFKMIYEKIFAWWNR